MPKLDTKAAASGAATGTAIMPGWSTAISGGIGLLSGLFNKQKAPKKVDYTPVDLAAEQRKAIEGNLGAEASIEQLLSQANRYTQGQASSLMEQVMPGYAKLSEKFLAQAGSNLDNPYAVPQGVTDNLTRIAAERGVSTGVRGQAGEFSLLRDLGVNMLDYGDRKVNQAQSLLATIAGLAPRVSPMSPLSFYVTPQQQAAVTGNNNTMKQGIDQGGNNANTAAANWNSSNLWDSLAFASAAGGAAFAKKGT